MSTWMTDHAGADVVAAAELLAAPAVAVEGLAKTYAGGIEAVKGIDFCVAAGEVFGPLGPNGAGKSTTIGMLTTTIVPSSGTAWLAGYDVVAQPLLARSVSSVVFQKSVVDAGLIGRANLELHAQLWGLDRAAAAAQIADLAETLGLGELLDRTDIGAVPAVAILPFFLAGALFPIGAMPGALTAIAKVLPLTHVLALLRYGIVEPSDKSLHDIWGMSNVTLEAWLSLAVVAAFAAAMTAVSIRVFSR